MAEPEIVAIGGSFGESLVHGEPTDWAKWGYDEDEEFADDTTPQQIQDEFFEKYDFLGNEFIGDPDEDYYQGMTFASVIRRKSDRVLFVYHYWKPVAKYSDHYVEPNGDEFGYPYGGQPIWVFQEALPFVKTGYIVKGS